MSELSSKHCLPCEGGIKALSGEKLAKFTSQLGTGWNIVNEHHLEREFKFKNFRDALEFTNRIGAIAEAEGHHPDIHLAWGSVKVTSWTHKALGLTVNDFILAAKIDEIIK